MGRLFQQFRRGRHVRSLLLQVVPFFPLLSGLIQYGGTLIERRKRQISIECPGTDGCVSVLRLPVNSSPIWPWAVVGNLARYAMYLGLAVVAAHGVVASILAYRAGNLIPVRTGWVGSGLLILMSLACLLGVAHVFLAPFPDDQILIAFPLEGDWSVGQGGPSWLTNTHLPYANQRYGLDLAKVGPNGKCFKGSGRQLHDHLSWGQAVRAPLSGTVIEAVKTYPDNEAGRVDDQYSEATMC